MKTKRILALAMLLCLFLTSCRKEDPWLEVTTGNATVSYNQTSENGVTVTTGEVTFKSTYEWKGDIDQPLPKAFCGEYYGKTSNLSADNNLGSIDLGELNGIALDRSFKRTFRIVNVNLKDGDIFHEFAPGDTMYYRAYAKVINGVNDTSYIYGEEKFTVMAGE
ncbi:MAG: hypothetical protein KBT28_03605 [Bacteroidales bacterium]|nr:hypothetical protein [Candidatus Colimorpha merdihippi]